jgi:osmotically-inducible protein OsmY
MRVIAIIAMTALSLAACEEKKTDAPAKTDADNTKQNERDRSDSTMKPGDQKENSADLGITQTIRQDIVKSDGLSMDAKNVKVVTAEGVVTLRGPVKSEEEKTQIEKIAAAATGVKRVDNQLEVKAN